MKDEHASVDYGSTLLSVTQAADYLGLSSSTVNKLRTKGGGPVYYQPTRRVLYAVRELDIWMEANRRRSTSKTVGASTALVEDRRRTHVGIDLAYRSGMLDGDEVPASRLHQIGTLYADAFEPIDAMHVKTLGDFRYDLTPDYFEILDCVCGWGLSVNRTAQFLHCRVETVAGLLRNGLVKAHRNQALAQERDSDTARFAEANRAYRAKLAARRVKS